MAGFEADAFGAARYNPTLMSDVFTLRFAPGKIQALAAQFELADDKTIIETGQKIAAGEHSFRHLKTIVAWKSARALGRVARNTEADVTDALRLAVSAASERSAIAILTGLRGMDVPLASAVMWAIAPTRFTIIDYRALESLGVRPAPTIEFYLGYLAYCHELAATHGVSLRELDRALWQWSEERRRG